MAQEKERRDYFENSNYRKISIKLRARGLFDLGHSIVGGGLKREGVYSQSNDKEIYDSLLGLLHHIFADSARNFTRQVHKFGTFLSQTISK